MIFRDPTSKIIGAADRRAPCPRSRLLESAYEACLAYELEGLGLRIRRQPPVPLYYKAVKLDCGFRVYLVVEGLVVVEIKCKEAIHPVDEAQLLSYLRLLELPIGLLLNFHVVLLKDGIRRMVNNYHETPLCLENPLTAKSAKWSRGARRLTDSSCKISLSRICRRLVGVLSRIFVNFAVKCSSAHGRSRLLGFAVVSLASFAGLRELRG